MNYEITVKEVTGPPRASYRVGVFSRDSGEVVSEHTVHVDEQYVRELGFDQGNAPELIRVSFQFLLKREPPSAIFTEFDLKVIGNYFPEYEETMRQW